MATPQPSTRNPTPSPRTAPARVARATGFSDTLPDEVLMLRLQDGDARAYEALVTRHRAAVASVARYTCGPDHADDAAQNALVAAWQHCGSYRPDRGTPRAWLLGIVRNRGIDFIRSHSARQRHLVCIDARGWTGIADASSAGEPAHAQVLRADAAGEVRRMLAELPPAQRQAIELSYFWGLTHQQVADRMGVPVGTVKGRMRLGLAKLRRSLDAERAAAAPELAAAA